MRRLLTTIVLVIIAFNMGAYVGKENMNKFYSSGKKVVLIIKDAVVWATGQWRKNDIQE